MIRSYSTCMPRCRYLRNILSRQSSAHNVSELIESLNAIDYWVQILYTCYNVNIPWMIFVTYFTDSNTGGHGRILCKGNIALYSTDAIQY